MPTWHLDDEGEIKTLSEERLRKRLRKGTYSGAELVRADGDETWRPLRETALFREEVPDPASAALRHREAEIKGYIGHLASFLAVMIFMGFPFWGLFWGIGVVSHTVDFALKMRRTRALLAAAPTALPAAAQPTPTAAPERVTAPPAPVPLSPWRAELEEALVAMASHAVPAEELAALRASGDELERAAVELRALGGAALRERLSRDAADLEVRIAAAPDARTAEALQRAADALAERARAAVEAESALARVEARQLAFLHEVEGLRAALATARLDRDRAETLIGRVREVRAHATAHGEVDEAVARARRAAQRVG